MIIIIIVIIIIITSEGVVWSRRRVGYGDPRVIQRLGRFSSRIKSCGVRRKALAAAAVFDPSLTTAPGARMRHRHNGHLAPIRWPLAAPGQRSANCVIRERGKPHSLIPPTSLLSTFLHLQATVFQQGEESRWKCKFYRVDFQQLRVVIASLSDIIIITIINIFNVA